MRTIQFHLAALGSQPQDARPMLHDSRTPLIGIVGAEGDAAVEAFLAARTGGLAAQAALAKLAAAANSGSLDTGFLYLAAAKLGDADVAFLAPARPGPRSIQAEWFLFDPVASDLRRDPRFWAEASRRGLITYWRKRGVWPDFCSDPAAPFDCKAAAQQAQPG